MPAQVQPLAYDYAHSFKKRLGVASETLKTLAARGRVRTLRTLQRAVDLSLWRRRCGAGGSHGKSGCEVSLTHK